MSRSHEGGNEVTSADVVIVGAGFAGLSAAERLSSMGASVLVLEGRDRVGGRSFSGEVAGIEVDLGATWVSGRHAAIRDLAARVGCTTTRQAATGRNVLWMGGWRRIYEGTTPSVSPVGMIDMARVQAALEKLVDGINVDAVWESPNAAALDAISFGEWLDQNRALPNTRALMTVVSKVQWGCIPGDVSLLHVLRYIRAAGGIDHMLGIDGGQQDRITETTQEIARRLAARLGDRVLVDTPVRRITQDENGVTVFSGSATFRARYALVTAAPAHLADITFEPALPVSEDGLATTWRMGALSKALIAYHKPFWRVHGFSGEAVTDTGPAFMTVDVSPADGGLGVLMAHCDPRGFDGSTPEIRRSRVVQQLVDLFGPQASTPVDYVDHCWGTETFAPGGPSPAATPRATMSHARTLTEPLGRIEWAGAETAGEWAGCMNGAVLSGQGAAERVAGRLRLQEGALA